MKCTGQDKNIILIGMPWSGKSTTGVLLAKALARPFLDTDVVIQAREGRALQQIIDREGTDALRRLEERYALQLSCKKHVVATGGSIVYSQPAMEHLKRDGFCVYLYLSHASVAARATHIEYRGLVRAPGQSLEELYEERTPLYRRYADVTVDCEGLSQDQALEALLSLVVA